MLFETSQERKLLKYPFRILFSNIPNVLICGTRIDRKTDSPKKIIHLKIQNIHTYPLCKTTHHLIISTEHPKNGIHGIRFYIQSRVNILIYQQKSYLQIASTTQSIRCFVVQMETKISLNKSMMIAIWRKK